MPDDDFPAYLSRFPVQDVIDILHCSQWTVYQYQNGRRTPRPWVQEMIRRELGPAPEPQPLPVGATRPVGRPRTLTSVL